MRRRIVSLAAWLVIGPLLVLFVTQGAPRSTSEPANAATCTPPPSVSSPFQLQTDSVVCQEVADSQGLLGPAPLAVPFEYYVPAACTVSSPCPVLYLLHGFGGSYNEMLGTPSSNGLAGCGTRSAWIAAETSGPQGFETDPSDYACPSTWKPAAALPMILVAPLGRVLPGGYGPTPPAGAQYGTDSYWVDWNPRYASRYDTPAPRFATFVTEELQNFVQGNFPTRAGRSWSSIAGVSLGGYGAYELGLVHPDLYTVMMAVSGAMNFLFAPAPQPGMTTLPVGVQPPVPVIYEPLPAVTGPATQVPLPSQASEVGTFTTALNAFGDPVADQAYFRGNMPVDLAMNARAYGTDSSQLLGIDDFWNDMVPQQSVNQLDAGQPPNALGNDLSSEPFENIVFPMNVDMETAFAELGVQNVAAIHQGNHADVYRNAWLRGLEQFAYDHLRAAEANGSVSAAPATFDYRTISTDFAIWGWRFQVERTPVEFLTLRSVSCHGLTLTGTGTVSVTVPDRCGTGYGGSRQFTVSLGSDQATDESADASSTPLYGSTVTVSLTALS